ncbi:MAG: hypothetical protein KC457_11500, partial [Myxococcales bacterium]|nr:hypothetical protein [Myxococcales bacterium]
MLVSVSVPASPEQLRRLAEIEVLLAALVARRPRARCYGRLRVRSGGRTRDLLLGDESLTLPALTVIDWQQAPLAAVFFAHGVDDDYELEIDDGHSVEGTVLARELLVFERSVLSAVDDGEVRLVRDAGTDTWQATDSALRSPLRPRDHRERGKVSSPIEVELDPTQRSAVELPADRSVLILGEAGFGKTTVALHRLARLRAEALARAHAFSALVLVPTPGLRRLLVALLERLGIRDVEVATFSRWIARQGRRVFPDLPARDSRDAPLAVSRLKRHEALRPVLPEIIRGTAAM